MRFASIGFDGREEMTTKYTKHTKGTAFFSCVSCISWSIVLQHKTDFFVKRVSLDPQFPPERFATLPVPAGTEVFVTDEKGRSVGKFTQREEGTPLLSEDDYRNMVEK